MRYVDIKGTNIKASRLALGCMRIGQMSVEKVEELIQTALDLGINFFDHADIYGAGNSEKLFGDYLKSNKKLSDFVKIFINKGYDYEKNSIFIPWTRFTICRNGTGYI